MVSAMNIPGFSTNGMLMMHNGVKKSLEDDDTLPMQKKSHTEFVNFQAGEICLMLLRQN